MAGGVISIDRFFGGRAPTQITRAVESAPITIDGSFTNPLTPVDIQVYGRQPRTLGEQSLGLEGENPSPDIAIGSFDTARGAESRSSGEKSADALENISLNQKKMLDSQRLLASAQLFQNVMNAQSQYENIQESAKANIYMANLAVADAKSRGAQQALQLQAQGMQQGDDVKVAMAAQGQDVNSGSVERIAAGQEAVGVYNAMLAEINASREMLGYELEITEYERQMKDAEQNRNMQILNSFLSFGAQVAPLGV